jgi:hypothetical protein
MTQSSSAGSPRFASAYALSSNSSLRCAASGTSSLTERRRRERNAHRESRADVKAAMREGKLSTVSELVAGSQGGSLDEYTFNLKTGGEVRLGYPGARSQSLTFTDGVKVAQAGDLAEAARLYSAGWDLGSPGRPGVRVHFPGTRQERLAAADEVYARPRTDPAP